MQKYGGFVEAWCRIRCSDNNLERRRFSLIIPAGRTVMVVSATAWRSENN